VDRDGGGPDASHEINDEFKGLSPTQVQDLAAAKHSHVKLLSGTSDVDADHVRFVHRATSPVRCSLVAIRLAIVPPTASARPPRPRTDDMLQRVLAWALAAAAVTAGGAHVSVIPTRLGHAVPRSYLGLSVEWDSVEAYARHAGALRRTLAPLARSQRGVALRIGGDSGDQSWWNPQGRPRPRRVLHNVTPRTLGAVAALRDAAGGGPLT